MPHRQNSASDSSTTESLNVIPRLPEPEIQHFSNLNHIDLGMPTTSFSPFDLGFPHPGENFHDLVSPPWLDSNSQRPLARFPDEHSALEIQDLREDAYVDLQRTGTEAQSQTQALLGATEGESAFGKQAFKNDSPPSACDQSPAALADIFGFLR